MRPSTIRHTAVVEATPEEVFRFLVRMGNHWRLADSRMRLDSLSPDGTGGRFTLLGPLGLRRRVRTQLERTRGPAHGGGSAYLVGHAFVGSVTRVRVSWRIRPGGAGTQPGAVATRVVLAATVLAATPLDRLLLLLGGRDWLRRRFAGVMRRLQAELEAPVQQLPAVANVSAPT
jgi:hypothetical protein